MITHIRSHRRWIPYRKITVAMVMLAKRYSFWGIHMNWISSSVSRKRFTKSWYYDEKLLDYGRKLVTKLGNLLMTAVLLLQRCSHMLLCDGLRLCSRLRFKCRNASTSGLVWGSLLRIYSLLQPLYQHFSKRYIRFLPVSQVSYSREWVSLIFVCVIYLIARR